jgi:AcrR family transcriptional regulator
MAEMPRPRGQTERGLRIRETILRRAADVASVAGLDGLSIGGLADDLGLSKSGLFAHFGSKECLQLASIEAARHVYVQEVIAPALAAGSGLVRLEGLCQRFLSYVERRVFPGGCFFAAAMAEFDCKPGLIKDKIAELQAAWMDTLEQAAAAAINSGDLSPGVDPSQLAFELEAALLSANWYFHLFDDASYMDRAREAILHRLLSDATERGRLLLRDHAARQDSDRQPRGRLLQ